MDTYITEITRLATQRTCREITQEAYRAGVLAATDVELARLAR